MHPRLHVPRRLFSDPLYPVDGESTESHTADPSFRAILSGVGEDKNLEIVFYLPAT
jgi:hypothetical protein